MLLLNSFPEKDIKEIKCNKDLIDFLNSKSIETKYNFEATASFFHENVAICRSLVTDVRCKTYKLGNEEDKVVSIVPSTESASSFYVLVERNQPQRYDLYSVDFDKFELVTSIPLLEDKPLLFPDGSVFAYTNDDVVELACGSKCELSREFIKSIIPYRKVMVYASPTQLCALRKMQRMRYDYYYCVDYAKNKVFTSAEIDPDALPEEWVGFLEGREPDHVDDYDVVAKEGRLAKMFISQEEDGSLHSIILQYIDNGEVIRYHIYEEFKEAVETTVKAIGEKYHLNQITFYPSADVNFKEEVVIIAHLELYENSWPKEWPKDLIGFLVFIVNRNKGRAAAAFIEEPHKRNMWFWNVTHVENNFVVYFRWTESHPFANGEFNHMCLLIRDLPHSFVIV